MKVSLQTSLEKNLLNTFYIYIFILLYLNFKNPTVGLFVLIIISFVLTNF